jgi:hypothetical protein
MGLLWDIMWHMSIGRDGLLAPPHVVIYVGALVSGLFSAYQILNMTIRRNHPGRAEAVPFWGVFYGPLGAMFSVWGALAMLTSAPFDDWWHNTYGLDVQILTPPHTILAIGIMTLQFGAMVGVLSLQNRYGSRSCRHIQIIAVRPLVSSGCLLFRPGCCSACYLQWLLSRWFAIGRIIRLITRLGPSFCHSTCWPLGGPRCCAGPSPP